MANNKEMDMTTKETKEDTAALEAKLAEANMLVAHWQRQAAEFRFAAQEHMDEIVRLRSRIVVSPTEGITATD